MKPGDKIKYIVTYQKTNTLVAIHPDGTVEFSINSAGWLSKSNDIVPLAQIKTPNPAIGDKVAYETKHLVTASINAVYDNTLDVWPDGYTTKQSFLISAAILV